MDECKLINHKVEDTGTFRLKYEKFLGSEVKKKNNIKWALNEHVFPCEISREDSFKLLSFVIDETRRKAKKEESFIDSLIKVDKVLPSLGFTKVPFGSFSRPVDLFIIEGDKRCFTHTKDYQRYFDWYKENISKEEAEEIFDKMQIKENYSVKCLIRNK